MMSYLMLTLQSSSVSLVQNPVTVSTMPTHCWDSGKPPSHLPALLKLNRDKIVRSVTKLSVRRFHMWSVGDSFLILVCFSVFQCQTNLPKNKRLQFEFCNILFTIFDKVVYFNAFLCSQLLFCCVDPVKGVCYCSDFGNSAPYDRYNYQKTEGKKYFNIL